MSVTIIKSTHPKVKYYVDVEVTMKSIVTLKFWLIPKLDKLTDTEWIEMLRSNFVAERILQNDRKLLDVYEVTPLDLTEDKPKKKSKKKINHKSIKVRKVR